MTVGCSGGSAGFMTGRLNFLSCGAATVQTASTQISPGCLQVCGSAFVCQMKPEITYIMETGQQLPLEKCLNKYPK